MSDRCNILLALTLSKASKPLSKSPPLKLALFLAISFTTVLRHQTPTVSSSMMFTSISWTTSIRPTALNLRYEALYLSKQDVSISLTDLDLLQFRSMWTEFEWENKVNVNTQITDLRTYLNHIMASTNMSCLTPEGALEGECGFLSANMYARSLFGEPDCCKYS